MAATRKTTARKSPAKKATKPAAEKVNTEESQAQEAPSSNTPANQATDTGENSQPPVVEESSAGTTQAENQGNATNDSDDNQEMEIEGVWVKSIPASFRRAGYRFTREGIGIALHALDEGQLEQLENEPDLIVERVTFKDVPFTKPETE